MHVCTNTSTHIHTYTQTHSTTDNYTIKAALDIPMETCIATSNLPTSQYIMYHDNVPCGKHKFTQI